VDEDQGTRVSALRERVVRGEYQVDCPAVAEAIVLRLGERALRSALLEKVLIAREALRRVAEDDSRGTG
jgi:hypothetical protein